jgi:predicted membrane chloride channel (bestrophin family)
VNRFLIWGIWSAANFVNLAADPAARVLYVTLAGTSTEFVMEVIRPVLIGTMAVTMILGIVSAATLFLTFFPTAAYRRWVEARAEGRGG